MSANYRRVETVPAHWRWVGLVACGVGIAFYAWAIAADPPKDGWEWGALVLVLALLVFVLGMLLFAKLTISVTDADVNVRWWILLNRTIPRADIASVQAVTYRPMREFGGWGIRMGRNGARCYSMAGNRAAELTLTDGRRVLLGSDDPEGLVTALS